MARHLSACIRTDDGWFCAADCRHHVVRDVDAERASASAPKKTETIRERAIAEAYDALMFDGRRTAVEAAAVLFNVGVSFDEIDAAATARGDVPPKQQKRRRQL